MISPLVIPHLEWHVAHTCNFTCESCGHFSNHGHKGVITLKDLEQWYSLWNKRIAPKNIALLGGEPLLNKEIIDILYMTRDMWDKDTLEYIDLVTNGVLLDKFLELPKALEDTKINLVISLHGNDAGYNSIINKVKALINSWKENFNIQVSYIDSYNTWLKFYKGFGDNMHPFEDGDYQESWKNCIAGQDCFQLLNGKIYKCAPLAYLPLQKEQFNLSPKWDHYLTYNALDPSCTNLEIEEFFNKKAESYCAMCPSSPQHFKKLSPLLPRRVFRLNQV
jgi:hypothetical protein